MSNDSRSAASVRASSSEGIGGASGDGQSAITFTKMHGLGNDYVYVNCFEQALGSIETQTLAVAVSDRHRGIGSDGLILIRPPSDGSVADVRMEMYNADGSRGEMCGNGIRCVAKYAVDHGLVDSSDAESTEIRVQTDRGVLTLCAFRRDHVVEQVRVDMGPPILTPSDIPVAVSGDRCIRAELPVGDAVYRMTCVSMGNPHAVVFMESVADVDLSELGPLVERHSLFPNRVNLHIACVQSRTEATMRSWERGSGMTMACGTGACAVLVAGVLEDRLDRKALVHLPGGDLKIEWQESPQGEIGTVFMTGPAVEVFTGQWPI
ncbi:MAG: diaminopimelate epimerase [Phycisphaerales bacterium]|nr:diaminopimelate epimerase [Phycisphaerales bacterium]